MVLITVLDQGAYFHDWTKYIIILWPTLKHRLSVIGRFYTMQYTNIHVVLNKVNLTMYTGQGQGNHKSITN
jgi:hypothetical protein